MKLRPLLHAVPAVLTCGTLAVSLCACVTSASTSPAAAARRTNSPAPSLGHAVSGHIQVTGAYIPQPASRDVAVAYFTLTDTGASGDVLLSASTDPASQPMVMRESGSGMNADTMLPVTGGLPVPAHGSVTLAPGGYHLMLSDPTVKLSAGAQVIVTLRLRDAGLITVQVPVTSLNSDAQTTAATPSMPGM
jgi:copper(I)-binding protein